MSSFSVYLFLALFSGSPVRQRSPVCHSTPHRPFPSSSLEDVFILHIFRFETTAWNEGYPHHYPDPLPTRSKVQTSLCISLMANIPAHSLYFVIVLTASVTINRSIVWDFQEASLKVRDPSFPSSFFLLSGLRM